MSFKLLAAVPLTAVLALSVTACGSGNTAVKASRSAAAVADKAKSQATQAVDAVKTQASDGVDAVKTQASEGVDKAKSAMPTVTVTATPTATKAAATTAKNVTKGQSCKTTNQKGKTKDNKNVTCKWVKGKRVWA